MTVKHNTSSHELMQTRSQEELNQFVTSTNRRQFLISDEGLELDSNMFVGSV